MTLDGRVTDPRWPSSIGRSVNINHLQILNDFISNDERQRRHNANLNYDTPKKIRKECEYKSPVDHKYHKCTSYKYDTGVWISTIINEWDLVCDRGWFISVTQSLYMSGFILSFLMFGYISDRYGRWTSLLLGGSIEIISGFGCAFASSVTWFMVFRFLIGLGGAGRSSSSYLIMIEWCGPKWRMHISTLGSLGWVAGYCLMPYVTMYFLHFRHMQLFVCFYELIFLMCFLILPESPRWLLTHRRFDEAYEVLLMAAKFNGLIKKDSTSLGDINNTNHNNNEDDNVDGTRATIDDALNHSTSHIALTRNKFSTANQAQKSANMNAHDPESSLGKTNGQVTTLLPYTIEEYNFKFKRLVNTIYAKEFTENENKLSIIDLFKWRNLRKYSLILSFAWAVNSFIYYGIALRVGEFGGSNLFTSFTIAGITELPSLAFTIICMKFLPRRTTNLFLFLTVGILCALQAIFKYYDQQWLQQSAIMMAKLFNSCSFTCILFQTMELFPTSIRQTAYSSCSLAGRIGSIMAPFVKELSQLTHELVPPVIYALLSLIEAVLVNRLPETKGSDLTDTLLEAEKFEGTDRKKEELNGNE